MDIHQLELFLAVMEAPGVTRAAEKVYLSPGAVSVQIHSLADELKTELFVRSGKRIVPTPAAVRLSERARAIVAQMREIEQEFVNDPATDGRPFHFATGATTLIHRLGRPLRLLRTKYPHTVITVTVATTEEMVAGVLDRRFDLALISLPCPEEGLRILPLFDEEILGVHPAGRRVAGAPVNVQPAALEGVPFLLYPKRSNMRSMIDRFFAEMGVDARVVMEADDTEAIKSLVEAGFGYSMLPQSALHGRSRSFQTFRIGGRRLVRRQALAMPKSEYPRALTESIASFLQTALAPAEGPREATRQAK